MQSEHLESFEEVISHYDGYLDYTSTFPKDKNTSRNVGGGRLRRWYWQKKMEKMCVKCGKNVKIGKRVEFIICDNAVLEIGDNVIIQDDVKIAMTKPHPHLYIGDNAMIGKGAIIAVKNEVSIGACSLIGQYSFTTDNNHGTLRNNIIRDQLSIVKSVHIGYDVWLGSGVRVMPGVNIGNGVVVGGNGVVTKDLPDYAIAVGVPAKVIKYRE